MLNETNDSVSDSYSPVEADHQCFDAVYDQLNSVRQKSTVSGAQTPGLTDVTLTDSKPAGVHNGTEFCVAQEVNNQRPPEQVPHRPRSVEFDRETGNPSVVHDGVGNEYRYVWANGSSSPSSVFIVGPRTRGEVHEYRRDGDVNQAINNALGLSPFGLVAIQAMNRNLPYRLFVGGTEQAGTLSLGAGVGVAAGPVSPGFGGSMPTQARSALRVQRDGTLMIYQGPQTTDGLAENHRTSITLRPDGSSRVDSFVGWVSQEHVSQILRDSNGAVVNYGNPANPFIPGAPANPRRPR